MSGRGGVALNVLGENRPQIHGETGKDAHLDAVGRGVGLDVGFPPGEEMGF